MSISIYSEYYQDYLNEIDELWHEPDFSRIELSDLEDDELEEIAELEALGYKFH